MFSLRRHEHSPQGTLREVRVYPLTFSEFSDGRREPLCVLWKEYCTFGGMPELMGHGTPLEKRDHLKLLWYSICLGDIARRNQIRKRRALEAAADLLCSFVGSPANPGRISASLGTLGLSVSDDTVRSYLAALENACLFSGARRFSIRERRYFRNIRKYYISDIGLLNAGTGFREQDFHCIMENVIFNELLARGWYVDTGVVESREMENGRQWFRQRGVCFVAEKGADRVYIQSSPAVPCGAEREQVLRPLRMIRDSFRKVVIVGSDIAPYTDDYGISWLGLFDFLLDGKAL